MVVKKECIKRISTIKQIIDGLNLCNGNNDFFGNKSIIAIILIE